MYKARPSQAGSAAPQLPSLTGRVPRAVGLGSLQCLHAQEPFSTGVLSQSCLTWTRMAQGVQLLRNALRGRERAVCCRNHCSDFPSSATKNSLLTLHHVTSFKRMSLLTRGLCLPAHGHAEPPDFSEVHIGCAVSTPGNLI